MWPALTSIKRYVFPVLRPPLNEHSAGKKETRCEQRVGFVPRPFHTKLEAALPVSDVRSGWEKLGRQLAPEFLAGTELVDRAEGTEVYPVSITAPETTDIPPDRPEQIVVIAHEIKRPPIVVETATGGSYRKRMFSAETSLIEALLLCERAKSRGETRIKVVILTDAE